METAWQLLPPPPPAEPQPSCLSWQINSFCSPPGSTPSTSYLQSASLSAQARTVEFPSIPVPQHAPNSRKRAAENGSRKNPTITPSPTLDWRYELPPSIIITNENGQEIRRVLWPFGGIETRPDDTLPPVAGRTTKGQLNLALQEDSLIKSTWNMIMCSTSYSTPTEAWTSNTGSVGVATTTGNGAIWYHSICMQWGQDGPLKRCLYSARQAAKWTPTRSGALQTVLTAAINTGFIKGPSSRDPSTTLGAYSPLP